MKISGISLAFIVAAAAAPSVASASSSSLRGGNDNGPRDTDTPHRLLGHGKKFTRPQVLEYNKAPQVALDNAGGKAQGGPFGGSGGTTTTTTSSTTTTTTAAGCAGGWKLNEAYCTGTGNCITFDTCPTSAASGDTIGELVNSAGGKGDIILISITSDTVIYISIGYGSYGTFYLSDDGTFFTTGSGGATYSIGA